MPLPHLVSPPPDSRMRPFEDREAEARLKLHILMARLRTALRTVMDGDAHPIPNWRRNIRDETVRMFSSSPPDFQLKQSYRNKSSLMLGFAQPTDSGLKFLTSSRTWLT